MTDDFYPTKLHPNLNHLLSVCYRSTNNKCTVYVLIFLVDFFTGIELFQINETLYGLQKMMKEVGNKKRKTIV